MRVSLEWFLLDNFAVNWLLIQLSEALGGVAVSPGRAGWACLLGALWDLLALGRWPRLLSPLGRVGCLLITALILSRREYLRSLLSLAASSLLLGGGLLLLTLGRTGPWTGGVLLGTVPLRTAIYGLCLLTPGIRAVRYLIHRGYEGSCRRTITLTVGGQAYTLAALVDSGNLLTEPLSGLPVVLVEGMELPPGLPLVVEGQGVVEVVRGTVEVTGLEPVSVYVGLSPLPLVDFQALLPGAALHEGRKRDVQKAQSVLLSALRQVLHPALSGVLGPHGGEPAAAARSRGGKKLHLGRPDQRGGPEPAHRAQPAAGGVHRPEV